MQRDTLLAAEAGARTTVPPRLQRVRDMIVAQGDRGQVQRDALTAFLVRVASAGLLYLTQVVLARWMGG